MIRSEYIGKVFGGRLVIAEHCVDDDWFKLGLEVPLRKDKYVLCRCLNCGRLVPTKLAALLSGKEIKRCALCSNIGNKSSRLPDTNKWCVYSRYAILNIKSSNDEFYQTVVDIEDYYKLKNYIWRITKKKRKIYVITGSYSKGTMIYMHAMILNQEIPNGFEVDHYDGNSLNNKKENLRIVPRIVNIQNSKVRSDNKIGIRGVSYDSRSGLFKVDFSFNKIRFYFIDFETIAEAVCCRNVAENYFGLHITDRNPKAIEYLSSLDHTTIEQITQYAIYEIELKLRESAGM